MSSLPLYLTLHPEYLSPQNHSKYDLWRTLCLTTHPLIYGLLRTRDNVTSTLSSHHCRNHITFTAFMTSHTLYTTSHTWQHKSYICRLTPYIWHYIHCMCVIKPRVSIAFNPLCVCHYTLYVWHHILYAWHHINITPLLVWHYIQYIYDIISNIYDITHTVSWKQND